MAATRNFSASEPAQEASFAQVLNLSVVRTFETAKLNDVDPEAYLADVITRIVGGHPQSQISALMPWAYAGLTANVA